MLSDIYLFHYNNYYNRQVKKEDSLTDYLQYQLGPVYEKINFIPNDYVDTKQVINWSEDADPDYLIEVQNGEIHSRWFIISTRRTTHGQFEMELHRDLVVDYYDETVSAPCFIEKAIPKSIRDPAIYNSEDMSFNQIKEREQLLYDETGIPWIVGYVPRDSFKTATKVEINAPMSGVSNYEVTDLGDYQYYDYKDTVINGQITNPTIRVMVTFWLMQKTSTGSFQNYYYQNSIKLDENGSFLGVDSYQGNNYGYYYLSTNTNIIHVPSNTFTTENAKEVTKNMKDLSYYFKNLSAYIDSNVTPAQYNTLKSEEGKIIHVTSTDQYYKVVLQKGGSGTSSQYIGWTSVLGELMQEKMVKSFDGHNLVDPINKNVSPFSFTSDTEFVTFKLEPLSIKLNTTMIASESRYHAVESPYDIFCMPFSDNFTIKKNGSVYIQNTQKNAALNIAQQIMTQVGSDNIYDVQLLPYCPVRYAIQQDGSFDIRNTNVQDILAGTTKVGVLMWAVADNTSFQLSVNIPEETDVVEKKIINQTDFVRFVAPNFSNSFEFSPQMNEGLDKVNVTCHFKPFNPYIKIQPRFKGLYGSDTADFNDGRGLVCTGDFSLSQATSAWADYELQNKNYQAMFNREVQNMKVNNAVQQEKEKWQIAAGALGGGASTGAAAGMAGGPYAAIAGAVVGTATSLAGGIRDYQLNEKLRNEAMAYKYDMYGYQLGNIKALPQGIAKTSAIAPDNKYVPFIEYYSCTNDEKEALRNKIIYNGGTIMMIGTINNYIRETPSYIKGRLIRLTSINEDYHILTALADEIYKGVFI